MSREEMANFAIFFGGIMIAAATVGPFFLVRLEVLEVFFVAGGIILLTGILIRRRTTRKSTQRNAAN